MVNVLIAFLFIFSSTAQAVVLPSGVPNVGLGAIGSTVDATSHFPLGQFSASTRKIFSLYVGGTMAGAEYHPLYKDGVAYRVTNGTTAYCFNFRGSSATALAGYQIVSDTAVIAWSQASALTSGLYQGGDAGQYALNAGATINLKGAEPGVFAIASQRYVGIQTALSVVYQVSMDCYEE